MMKSCTIEGDSFFDDPLPDFLLPREFLVEILKILLRDHLPDRYQKLSKFLNIQDAIIIAIKQKKILLVFLLLLNGYILLDLLLSISLVLIDSPELCDLPIRWHLG